MGFGYKVFFTERAKHRVICWDPDVGSVRVVAGDGATGAQPDQQLQDPYGLAIDHTGHLLIADKEKHRVLRLTNRLEPLRIRDACGHRANRAETPLECRDRIPWCPTGIARDERDGLLISYSDDHTIYRIAPNGDMEHLAGIPPNRQRSVGLYIERFAAGTERNSALHGPTTLVHRQGSIWFIERGFQTVRELRPGGGIRSLFPGRLAISALQWHHIPEGGRLSDYHTTFPSGLALDGHGRLYVSDVRQRAVIRIDLAADTFTKVFEVPEHSGISGGPSAICFGPDGTPWVLDSRSGTVIGCEIAASGAWVAKLRLDSTINGRGLTVNPAGAGIVCSAI